MILSCITLSCFKLWFFFGGGGCGSQGVRFTVCSQKRQRIFDLKRRVLQVIIDNNTWEGCIMKGNFIPVARVTMFIMIIVMKLRVAKIKCDQLVSNFWSGCSKSLVLNIQQWESVMEVWLTFVSLTYNFSEMETAITTCKRSNWCDYCSGQNTDNIIMIAFPMSEATESVHIIYDILAIANILIQCLIYNSIEVDYFPYESTRRLFIYRYLNQIFNASFRL